MKLLQLLEATRLDEIELPDLEVGDELMVGKFKNRNATIKGFKTDKHNQPIVKTDKGDQQVFKGRVKKLMNQSGATATEDAAIRTYDSGVLEWLQKALSRPDADDLYLHGSRQVQNVFSPEGKRHEHSLLHFSKLTDPRFKNRPHHAEYYGPNLFLCKLSYSKPFDVRYPNKEPAQMHQELVPRGRKYQLDYGDIYHIIEPALAKGYDMFVVWEVSVGTESYAVPEANQVQVIDTYNSREKV